MAEYQKAKRAEKRAEKQKVNEMIEVVNTDKIRKSRGGNAKALDLLPGDAASNVTHLLAIKEIAQYADRDDPESLRNCYHMYLQYCQANDCRVSNIAAYASMGLTRKDVDNYLSGNRRTNDPRYRELMIEVKADCEMSRELLVNQGAVNPVTYIFSSKVHDHYNENAPDPADVDDGAFKSENTLVNQFKQIYDQSDYNSRK